MRGVEGEGVSAKRRVAHRMVVIRQRRARLWKKIARRQAEALWRVLSFPPPRFRVVDELVYRGKPIVVRL